MDTLTHALSGALLARVSARSNDKLSAGERALAGFLAAAFPDLDYLLFLVDRLNYLNWHRGATHSLLLLPLWALLLAVLFARLTRGLRSWRAFYGVCALGIGMHILGDVITVFGTKLLWPLSDTPLALGIVFDIDPYIAVIVAIGFAGAVWWRPQQAAGLTVALLAIYVSLQTVMYWKTIAVGEAYRVKQNLENAEVYAVPQPFSPVTWKLIVAQADRYFTTYLNHLARNSTNTADDAGFPWSMLAAYRPVDDLRWSEHRRFGDSNEAQAIAHQVWRQDRFGAFRRFAVLPALYRFNWEEGGGVCAWFTDLRYNFPVVPPTFRYGMCGDSTKDDWRLYRLRYLYTDERQLL